MGVVADSKRRQRKLNAANFLHGNALVMPGRCEPTRGNQLFNLGFVSPNWLAQRRTLQYSFAAFPNELFNRQRAIKGLAQRLDRLKLQGVRSLSLVTPSCPEPPCLFAFNTYTQCISEN